MDPELKTAALNIFRRLPASNLKKNVNALLNLLPDHADELAQVLDQVLGNNPDRKGKIWDL
jgi:F-actin capping protein, beta subunit